MPYFIVLGTIEPRKNHLLLLNLWARLAAALPKPPRLIVIGARGWENEQVVDMLERSQSPARSRRRAQSLGRRGVGAMLGQARALLVPSFIEGFGLPLAEALASGVPVICSDIPAFREVGARRAGLRSTRSICSAGGMRLWIIPGPDSRLRAAQLQRMAHWQPPRWSDHFDIVEKRWTRSRVHPAFP